MVAFSSLASFAEWTKQEVDREAFSRLYPSIPHWVATWVCQDLLGFPYLIIPALLQFLLKLWRSALAWREVSRYRVTLVNAFGFLALHILSSRIMKKCMAKWAAVEYLTHNFIKLSPSETDTASWTMYVGRAVEELRSPVYSFSTFESFWRILDLPSGEEGSKLDEKQITKAYKAKALQLHPDKRPNDPYANDKFQRLNSSYAILINPRARKLFDKYYIEELVLTKDQENILFGLDYLIFVVGGLVTFPDARNKYSFAATILCYHIAFEVLCESNKLRKLWSMMVRVGDYLKRISNLRQDTVLAPAARIDEEPE